MGYVLPVKFDPDDRGANGPTFEESYDVVVIGFGAAGACAAIAAAEAGASVLVLDRFYGGGSTAQSGGVVYAGGGTRQQAEAGVTDTPEAMFVYLQRELGGAVSDETLRRFVEDSSEMISWLEHQGVEFEGSLCPYKTSYPTNRHYLYYSGNEQVPEFAAIAPPAPRGHRTRAKNFSGATFYARLKRSALEKGVRFRALARATRLVLDGGRVVGVEYEAPPLEKLPRGHERLTSLAAKLRIYNPPLGKKLQRYTVGTQMRLSQGHSVGVRGGVVLATGGFSFNRKFVERYAPKWYSAKVPPLGTISDDGAALTLTEPLNAGRGHMDCMSGWRFIAPPAAFMRGILVDREGARIGNEQLYGATLAKPLVEQHGGRGYLILDAATWRQARSQIRWQAAFFHLPQMLWLFSPAGHVKAGTLGELAPRFKIDPGGLERTVADYNEAILQGAPDHFGKADEWRTQVATGPFYAIDCSTRSSNYYPFTFITLGGLLVDERSGEVLKEDGGSIPGLYAAGRAAVGLCSNSYVSGMSLADAVFSGRRAGAHAAGQVRQPTAPAAGVA